MTVIKSTNHRAASSSQLLESRTGRAYTPIPPHPATHPACINAQPATLVVAVTQSTHSLKSIATFEDRRFNILIDSSFDNFAWLFIIRKNIYLCMGCARLSNKGATNSLSASPRCLCSYISWRPRFFAAGFLRALAHHANTLP